MDSAIDIGMYIFYILLVVGIVGVLFFAISQTFSDLKGTKGALIGVAALLVVFFLSYTISPANTGAFYDKMGISPNLSKVIGGGLVSTYVIFAGAIISILYSSIIGWFK